MTRELATRIPLILQVTATEHLQDFLECAEEIRALAERVLPRDNHFLQTDGNVSGTQVPTTAACSLWHKGRVEPGADKTTWQHQVAGVRGQL